MVPNRPFSATAAGTDSGATASAAAVTDRAFFVTSISGHTDTDAIITIEDGSTVVWESKIDISLEGFSFNFPGLLVPCTPGAAANGKVASSTTDCQVNITGFSLP